MIDLQTDAFTADCRNVVDGRAYQAWPGVLVIVGIENHMNIRFLEHDHPGHLWHVLKGADNAAMVQPVIFDHLPALFLITAPKHPDPTMKFSTFWIRHMDGAWEELGQDIPWFGAATASSMRNFMCTGKRTEVKYAADQRLYGRVLFDAPPPVDRHKRI